MALDIKSLKQSIIWTALPNKIVKEDPLLTVYVSPHLYANENTSLHYFPDFLHWPELLKEARFYIIYDDKPPIEIKATSLEPDAQDYWKALFTDKSDVIPWLSVSPDPSKRDIQSFIVRDGLDYLKNIYQKTAVFSPFELPPFAKYQQDNPVANMVNELKTIKKEASSKTRPIRDVFLFYNSNITQLPIDIPKFDFHQSLSAMGDHPTVLRKLGLLLDFNVPNPSAETGSVKLMVKWPSAVSFNQNQCPKTLYHFIKGKIFEAQPRQGSEIVDGKLNLERAAGWLDPHHPIYDLIQIDADGAILKLINTAETLDQGLWTPPSLFEEEYRAGLANLRSSGISLTRYQRKNALKSKLKAASDLRKQSKEDDNDDYSLFADDLLRGYRVDILDLKDKKGDWHSVCLRCGKISFPGTGLEPLLCEDEGYVKASSASSPQPDADFYLHESLLHWEGWSLVAPHPGLSLSSGSEQQDHPNNTPLEGFPYQANYEVLSKSLPRLRFGHSYLMKVRTADLAGNGLDLCNDRSGASNPITYLRYEPLSPPSLVPTLTWKPIHPEELRYTPGESLEHMVIRSDQDITAEEYVVHHAADEFQADNQRFVAPPRTSQLMAETFGAFDPWLEAGDYDKAFKIACLENGQLNAFEPGSDLKIPYLPDASAEGVSFWFNPEQTGFYPQEWKWESLNKLSAQLGKQAEVFNGVPYFIVHIPWNDTPVPTLWPTTHPFRIQLKESEHPGLKAYFKWAAGQRLLTVFLQKAAMLQLRYSSRPSEKMLNLFGILELMKRAAQNSPSSPNAQFIQDKLALSGLFWMLSPARTITLVHAVQRPIRPQIITAECTRELGRTFAFLGFNIQQNTASSGKLEVFAEWQEPHDDPNTTTSAPPIWDHHQQQVLEFQIAPKYPDRISIGLNKKDFKVPGQNEIRHEFGDTRHRLIKYSVRAATRFREYFSEDILAKVENITQTSLPEILNVLSSSRPAAPRVVYVLPNFGWSTKPLPNGGVQRIRQGGLRIYLERPWFSSGEGELLGVALYPDPDPAHIPAALQKLVTQWGIDPLWPAPEVFFSPALIPQDFLVPQHGEQPPVLPPDYDPLDIKLAELPDQNVRVAGFPVQYNLERALWYCDLQINENKVTAHMPFIRLALVRFQPNSIPHAFISPVALTDFVQIPPRRTLTINRSSNGDLSGQLGGIGPISTAERHFTSQAMIQKIDPKFEANREDPLGWIEATFVDGKTLLNIPNSHPNNDGHYSYSFHIPSANLPKEKGHRLVIWEKEVYKNNNVDVDRVVFVDTYLL
jgi:hypothetical protein